MRAVSKVRNSRVGEGKTDRAGEKKKEEKVVMSGADYMDKGNLGALAPRDWRLTRWGASKRATTGRWVTIGETSCRYSAGATMS